MAQTAEEFLTGICSGNYCYKHEVAIKMKEFAEIHVKEELKEAAEKVFYTTERDSYRKIIGVKIDKESIINSYPTKNIK
jgi:hypothetical protein